MNENICQDNYFFSKKYINEVYTKTCLTNTRHDMHAHGKKIFKK